MQNKSPKSINELEELLEAALGKEEEATRQGYQMGVVRDVLMALRRKVQDIYQNQRPKRTCK